MGEERQLRGLLLSDIKAGTLLLHAPTAQVTSLNLSNNLLYCLDLSAMRYRALTSLLLSDNRLQEIPRGLHLFMNLRHLDLTSNAISDLSPLRDDHPQRLQGLLLRGTPLASLLLWLHGLLSLQMLEVDPSPNLREHTCCTSEACTGPPALPV